MKDPRMIWRAIDWGGDFDAPHDTNETPTDREFAEHFERLLNPEEGPVAIDIPQTDIYIPILDDDITPNEVEKEIQRLKPGKAAGPDGIGPGILRLIPDAWIILITCLLNIVFTGVYPLVWALAKFFVIYKKGGRPDPGNYRGISVLSALAKVYDSIMNRRLSLWYRPKVEQAGAQSGRGCLEQILTIRLLIDTARKKGYTLYIAFIDYRKAYDKVNRSLLLNHLASKGCGNRFLQALGQSLQNSISIIGDETIESTMGVRQGGSTSCSLFTLLMDYTIDKLRQVDNDGWLGDLHTRLLMDDTVVLSANRASLLEKLHVLHAAAVDIGMDIHPYKSQYIAVNPGDTFPVMLDNVCVSFTNSYNYLGTPVAAEPLREQISSHVRTKSAHVFKFSSFCKKNCDSPFAVKKLVWNSAIQSALFYSCETWLSADLKCLSQPYLRTIKEMVGVRSQCCTDILLIETGIPPAQGLVYSRQKTFLAKLRQSPHFPGSPVQKALDLAIDAECPMGKWVSHLEGISGDPAEIELQRIRASVASNTSSRRVMYRLLNPALNVHPMYKLPLVAERCRKATSRLRLGSHSLKIETGRWSRIPREARLCMCGEVQDEVHVLLYCPITRPFREREPRLNFSSPQELMNGEPVCLATYCRSVLQAYQ